MAHELDEYQASEYCKNGPHDENDIPILLRRLFPVTQEVGDTIRNNMPGRGRYQVVNMLVDVEVESPERSHDTRCTIHDTRCSQI